MGDHLIVMHSAVRALPGYNRHDAPAIYMDGPSTARQTEHGRAVTAQLKRPQTTLNEALHAGIAALGAAHVEKSVRRQAREAVEDYFYNGDFGGGDEFQNDVIASLGLEIGLGGRADANEP